MEGPSRVGAAREVRVVSRGKVKVKVKLKRVAQVKERRGPFRRPWRVAPACPTMIRLGVEWSGVHAEAGRREHEHEAGIELELMHGQMWHCRSDVADR